jgi:dynein heavy chain 1
MEQRNDLITTTQDLQGLIDYLSNISSIMLDVNKDIVYKELLMKTNNELVKSFASDRNTKLLCISKVDQDTGGGTPPEIIIETDLQYKGIKASSICFIKKESSNLDLTESKSISSQLQVLNLSSEGNDMNVFLFMQNYIQSAFSPLFNSYQNAIVGGGADQNKNIKSNTFQTVQNKMAELIFLLNQSQKNSDIPNVKIEADPELKARVEKIKVSGREPVVEDFQDKINEEFIMKLIDNLNRWKIDINSVLKLDRQISQGNALQEVNFWKDYETTLIGIKKQLDSSEVKLTLDILKSNKKFFATTSFEEDTKLEDPIRKANSYNNLLKDLPIVSITTTNSIDQITNHLRKIFEHLRTKMKISNYPVSRTYSLIEVLSKDLNTHLLDILQNSNLMNSEYEDFRDLYKKLKELFNTWTKEYDSTKREINVWQRSRHERTFTTIPTSFEHNALEKRIKDLKKFRSEHNNLRDITQSLTAMDHDVHESPLTKELDHAFSIVTSISILDLSKDGEALWCNVRNDYNKKTEKIETQISNFLIDKLASATNPNEQFRIFAKFSKLISRPRVQNAIHEYQSQLVNSISSSLKDLRNKLLIGYNSNTAYLMSKIRGIPDVSGHVIWLKQFQRKLNCYRDKMRMVLGEGWETHNEGKNIKEIIDSLFKQVNNSSKIVEAWSKEIFNVESYSGEKILDIVSRQNNLELRVNFDEKHIDLFKEARLISSMGIFSMHALIVTRSNDIKTTYPMAILLQDSIRTFNQTCLKIRNEPRVTKLIARSKKEIQDLIGANMQSTWGNIPKLERFSKELCEKTSGFEENVRDLIGKIEQIHSLFNHIAKSELVKESIEDKIMQIQKIIDEITDTSNMHIWIAEIDSRLEAILAKKLEEVIEQWIKEFNSFGEKEDPLLVKEASVHKIKLKDQMIYLEPSVNEAREYWYSQLHQSLAIVCSSRRLENRIEANFNRDALSQKETTYRSIIKNVTTNLRNCYVLLEDKISEVQEYVKTWLSYQVLWDIQPKNIYEKLGDDMEKWQQLMNELRAGRKTFDNSETEKQFGGIFIDYSMVQAKINNKYDAWHKEILNKFAATLNDNMKTFYQVIYNARTNLENNNLESASTDIVGFITEISEIKKNVKTWQTDIDKYKNGKKILDKQRFHYPNDFCNMDQLDSEWSKLKQILSKKSKTMEDQIPNIQARITAEENVINDKIKELDLYWNTKKPHKADTPGEAMNILSNADRMIKSLKDDYVRNCKAKEMLDMEFSDPNKLDNIEDDIKDLKEVWTSLNAVWSKIERHGETPFAAVIPEKLKVELQEALNELGLFPNKARTYEAFEIIKNKINNLRKINMLITDLRTEAIKERHWRQILTKISIRKNINDLILFDFWNADLTKHEKYLRDIINTATGELVLESFMKNSKEFWTGYELEMVRYKDKCKLIKGWDDLFLKLDEHINSFQSMSNSPFYHVFKDEIEPWKDKLEKIRILFNEWIDVQRRWVYLEGIFFGSADIMNELASDYNKFKSIDSEFTGLMKKVAAKPLILEVISIPSIKSILEEKLKSALERIQKALYNFLEKQRQSFARFYFIGDEDLLEIIGNSKDINKIQRHFNKMFAGLNSLITPDGNEITHMVSREREEVKFETHIKISDDPIVYVWLSKIEEQMRISLATKLERAVNEICTMDYINKVDDFVKWIECYPAQITVLASQVLWSSSIESALNKKPLLPTIPNNFTLADEEKVINTQLSALSDQVLKDITVDMRKKLEQLITELVHQRDVVRILQNRNVESSNNFDWLYYMRYYFSPKNPEILKKLQIKMSNAPFDYGFEYLGVAEKLIQTPLTDRCYLTLTQALYFRMGGSPFGPAGTGKTESVKALGGQLGRFTLVFNCDETFDFKAMGRIFIGLCQVGAWGCFDEFNRLEERILSAVSQQILTIQLGLREHSSQIDLMGTTIKLNHQMGTFVTMNPDYAGRSQLPDNLKQLFRQMAMVKPDKDMIAQVTLYSQGYKTAERLSSKMVSLFELCHNQLSSQSHYDFGLRALKSVLVNAGNLKRREDKERTGDVTNIDIWEQGILLKSVCDTLIPKLVAEDITLFNSLLIGVFPDARVSEVKEDLLRSKIIELCKIRNLLPEERFIDKIIQLYSIQKMHHGVMMVGCSGTGKSAAWKILLEAMQLVDGIKGESYIIDPKAVNKDNLYGKLDQTTLDWTDGIFTGTLRKILDNQRGESGKRHWIIFDGDVDPEWAENLNSVLDDNKLLTLPHGDRLSIPPNVRIMFEVESLKYATLATVSRCGMVWFSEDIINLDMVFNHYLMRLTQNNYDDVMNYKENASSDQFDKKGGAADNATVVRKKCIDAIRPLFAHNGFVSQALEISSRFTHVMDFTRIRVLESMFALIRKGTSNVLDYNENHSEYPFSDEQIYTYMTKWICVSMIWGFGGSLSLDQRSEFSNKLKDLSKDIEFPYDNNLALIDYEVKIGENQWSPWKKKVPNTDIDTNKVSDADVVITTVDTVRHQEILCSWISEHRPFILCGPPGSGKTMTLMATLKVLTDFEMVFINFSSSTTPDLILKTFDHYCEYKKLSNGTILRPKQANKWLVVFCDEINLPDVDKYSTQVVITFLREITEQNGFWRPQDKQWISLERIQFVGACNPPTDVGRHPLNNRFLRHCPLLYVDFPGKDSLKQIYGTFNRALLRKASPELRNYSEALTDAMVEFYTRSQKHYTPDIQPHYIYSPRELTRWKHALNESIESINTPDDLVRLWAHEALRLFQDRLVLPDEKEWCDKLVDEVASTYFPNLSNKALERPILFTNLMSQRYVSCEVTELIKNIEGKLKIFYEEELNVPLVIFDSVLEHILRIDRVLKQPIGHLLLVGASGVGKTTLSRFVAWMNNLTVFQIKAGRNYGVNEFDDDLRSIMKRAGCKGEKICFIFDESNVLGPAFLERMNALLASGEVPGLFEGEEYMSLINTAKEYSMKESKVADTEEEIYKAFIKGVQRNLHVVFTMNPLSPDFSNRAASSPALYNRCVIDWFGDWSREGLWQVANKLTEYVELRPENFKAMRNKELDHDFMHHSIVEIITSFHIIVKDLNTRLMKSAKKFNYVTPRDFLDFIKHFTQLQKEKNEELIEQQVHINKGLEKIVETEKTVGELKVSLGGKEVELNKKQIETKAKFDKIMEDTETARKRKEQAEIQKTEIEKMKTQIQVRSETVQKELLMVKPMMEEAKKAVAEMPARLISEIKSIKVSNDKTIICLRILAVIFTYVTKKVMPKGKMDWEDIKKALAKEEFLSTIKNVNGEDLPKEVVNYIKKEKNDPENKWDLEAIKKASTAVGIMAGWVEATLSFSEIVNNVQPLNDEINALSEKRNHVEKEYEVVIHDINELEKNITQLKNNYEQSVVESNAIKRDMDEVKSKVERSEKLLDNLSSEKTRWSEQMRDFQSHINNLLGDTFLSSSFLAYIGFYDAYYRKFLKESAKEVLNKYNIIYTNTIDEVDWLTKPNDKVIWQKCNLPADNICLENATILQRFNKYPLIIDPANQATEFIKNFYANKKLNTTSFSDSNFLKTLESALRFGYPVLVQDVEKIDPIMNSLLNKEIHKTGGRNLIRIGDQEIDFSNGFNMFMVTRDPTCSFTPDLCSRVTFLNFTITPSSLQNQILSLILKSERPEVDKAKEDLVRAQREYKLQLRELEDNLLTALNSEGNLLENDKVMSRLEEIKKKSSDISKEVSKTEDIMRDLETTTNEYLPIATMASRIFFAMETLESIHYLYRYSLAFFMDVLYSVIKSSELDKIPKINYAARQEYIIKELFTEIYHRVGYSLLNKDQIIFATKLAQIRLGDKFRSELNILLKAKSSILSNPENVPDRLLKGKLTLEQRRLISELIKNDIFNGLVYDMQSNESKWLEFIIDATAENSVPLDFIKSDSYNETDRLLLAEICKMVILLIFRPDRMINSGKSLLRLVFDDRFVSIPELDLAKVIDHETHSKSPILLCSAPGHDASSKIEQLARKLNKRFMAIAIGSSEGFDLVEKNFHNKIKAGEWLVLKNVHLAPTWLNELEKKLHSTDPDPKFRLFLTMEFNPKIPANVLRISRKFVFELPAGIKHSLIRSYNNVLLPARSEKPPLERCRLHFLLAWFHAVIGERLRYVPIGWSKYYEFNEADQRCAMDALDEWLDLFGKDKNNIDPDKIPWDAIRTIISQSMYGGKIDNEYDHKILESLVSLYFNTKAYNLDYPLFKASSSTTNMITIPEKRNK